MAWKLTESTGDSGGCSSKTVQKAQVRTENLALSQQSYIVIRRCLDEPSRQPWPLNYSGRTRSNHVPGTALLALTTLAQKSMRHTTRVVGCSATASATDSGRLSGQKRSCLCLGGHGVN